MLNSLLFNFVRFSPVWLGGLLIYFGNDTRYGFALAGLMGVMLFAAILNQEKRVQTLEQKLENLISPSPPVQDNKIILE